MKTPVVLSIAGSDPSGGAGIQADLKTFTSLGVYGAAVITCLTVQNTVKVYDSFALPGKFVHDQILAVLTDLEVGVIKTGMLGNAEIAEAVGTAIEGRMIVCDPVMISKSGYALMEESAMKAVEEFVIRKARVLTPNYHELMRLCGDVKADPITAGEALLSQYSRLEALLVKGGHIDESGDRITDTLLLKQNGRIERVPFEHKRVSSENTHGTGCTLSSAITALLATGKPLRESVEKSIHYISSLIEYSKDNKLGKGHGPLIHYKENKHDAD